MVLIQACRRASFTDLFMQKRLFYITEYDHSHNLISTNATFLILFYPQKVKWACFVFSITSTFMRSLWSMLMVDFSLTVALRRDPAALWSLASLSALSAPAVLHNQKDLNCQGKWMCDNVVFLCRLQKQNHLKDISVLGRLVEAQTEQDTAL